MDTPGFWSVLPAHVRYNKNISDFAKILFSEITALSNKDGYSSANNGTLGEWHGKDPKTISRVISKLKAEGLIRVEINKSKAGTYRKIYAICTNAAVGGTQKSQGGVDINAKRGYAKKSTQKNTTSINTINNNKGVVSVPKTKAQAFAETIEQAEFPASFPDGLNGYLKRYFANLHEVDPQKFCRAADVKKIIKQVYSIREGGHSDEYLIKLIALCNEKGWRSVSVDYLKDETNNEKMFNDGGVMRPNTYKIA